MTRTTQLPRATWRVSTLAACLCLSARAHADYEPHEYTEPGSGLVLEYNLYVPSGYDAARKYPLLVFLHAAGQPEDLPRSLSSDGKGWTGSFLDNGDAEKYPSFFLVPISQTNASGWGDGRSDAEKFEGRLTIVVLQELVASGEYNIDADRLYVTGPSMGGRGTWDMLEKHPGLFAAAVPAAAPGLDDAAKVVGENIWAINGEKDSTVQDNRDTISAIRALGGNPIYTELAGHGHDTWRSIYPTDAFMQWLYAQRRGVPWWNVAEVPKITEPLTPGQPVVTGPTEPAGGSGGMAGAPVAGTAGAAQASPGNASGGAGPGAGGAPANSGGGAGTLAGQAGAVGPNSGGGPSSSQTLGSDAGSSDASCRFGMGDRDATSTGWLVLSLMAALFRRRRTA